MAITITVRKAGPYFIDADDATQIRLVDHEGHEIAIPGRNIALCRCGASNTKPFCDRTHRDIGFLACETASRAAEGAATPSAATTVAPDGAP